MLSIGKRKALGHHPCGGLFPPLGQSSSATGLPTTPNRLLRSDATGKVSVLAANPGGIPYVNGAGIPSIGAFASGLSFDDGFASLLAINSTNANGAQIEADAAAGGSAVLVASSLLGGARLVGQGLATAQIELDVASLVALQLNSDPNGTSWASRSNANAIRIPNAGRVLINGTTDDGVNQLQVTGSIAASTVLKTIAGGTQAAPAVSILNANTGWYSSGSGTNLIASVGNLPIIGLINNGGAPQVVPTNGGDGAGSFGSATIRWGSIFVNSLNVNNAGALVTSQVALTDAAAAQVGTLTNAPTAGNPAKWIQINDNGTVRKIPTWL